MTADESNVFTVVKASELYPLPETERDEGSESCTVPFAVVPGEGVCQLAETRDGLILALSNYRFHVSDARGVVLNVPVSCIESCEQRDLFQLSLSCKDGRMYRIELETNSLCEMWVARLSKAVADSMAPSKMQDVFAFGHWAWATEDIDPSVGAASAAAGGGGDESWFKSELLRLRFDVSGAWRVSGANRGFRLCSSYPPEVVVPASVTDESLAKIAHFRMARRFPAVVWRHPGNGAVLLRCAQPEVGWFGSRSTDDEHLIRAVTDACSFDRGRHSSGGSESSSSMSEVASTDVKDVLILDARSYAAAVGNRARGGGAECPEYYPNAEIQFMNLVNIHWVRKSFQAVRVLCNSPSSGVESGWFGALDATKWLHYASSLMKAAVRAATALDAEGRPVLIHCSDGWDRTPQIASLAELMLDPHYRTVGGFRVLVEREWLDYGHKMADRCGLPFCTPDTNERSPIFLQWLDCIHQLLLQFPCCFEFNLGYLAKLASHVHSSMFGTFLRNSLVERKKHSVCEQTRSVWEFLRQPKFRNLLYDRCEDMLWPRTEVRDLLLWRDVYASDQRIEATAASVAAAGQAVPPDSREDSSENENEANMSLVKEELEKYEEEEAGDEPVADSARVQSNGRPESNGKPVGGKPVDDKPEVNGKPEPKPSCGCTKH